MIINYISRNIGTEINLFITSLPSKIEYTRTALVHHLYLQAKASKGMHQVCLEKSPDRHLSIHPR